MKTTGGKSLNLVLCDPRCRKGGRWTCMLWLWRGHRVILRASQMWRSASLVFHSDTYWEFWSLKRAALAFRANDPHHWKTQAKPRNSTPTKTHSVFEVTTLGSTFWLEQRQVGASLILHDFQEVSFPTFYSLFIKANKAHRSHKMWLETKRTEGVQQFTTF